MKNSLNILTLAASTATATFIALLAFGLVSLPIFLASFIAWMILVTVKAYSPSERACWLPRKTRSQIEFPASARRVSLPLAA